MPMPNPYMLSAGAHDSPDQGRCAMELGEAERFWAKVAAPHPLSCWAWLGAHDEKGYGRFGKRRLRAHRAAYELAHGAIGDGLVVLHECDNPGCVNPRHLRAGTQLDNIADRNAKGRTVNPPSRKKLTSQQAAEMRAAYGAGATQQVLADRFGVSRGNVSKIVNGVSYVCA